MGFFDTLKDKLRATDDYPEDSQYDEYFDDEPEYAHDGREAQPHSNGLLGNTPRPEADSVSVYTRSGRRIGGNGGGNAATTYAPTYEDDYDEPMAQVAPEATATYNSQGSYASSYTSSYAPAGSLHSDRTLTAVPRPASQLPPYVMTPQSYDDCQTVVRRVRTNQAVVLSFRNTNIDAAKRIFDFCAGLACGVGGAIEELGDRCFVVLPAGKELSDSEIEKLVADGTITR